MSLLHVVPANKWLLAGPAAGLALLFALSYFYLLPTPPAPPAPGLAPVALAPDTLATADTTAPPPAEPPLFAPGSGGLQIAQLIARHDYRGALQQLDRIKEAPAREQLGLGFQRAYSAQALGDHQTALGALGQLQQAHADLEDYRRSWLGRSLEQSGALPEAMAQCDTLLAAGRHPDLVEEARLRLAELCLKQKQQKRALELLAAAAAGPRAPEALARLAQVAPDSSARQHRLALWRRFPAHPLALESAGQASPPLSTDENSARAMVYFHHKHYRQADQLLKSLLTGKAKAPQTTEARLLLGQVRGAEGKWEEARSLFAKLWDREHPPAALYQLALALGRLNRDREALERYRLFAERFPQDPLAHEALWQAGRIAERADDFAQADQHYARLAEEYPASPYRDEARWRGGFMAYCRDQYPRALEIFAALGNQASDAQLADQGLFWAGKAAQHLGRTEEAKRFFQQAADHFPRSYYATRAAGMGYRPAPPSVPDSLAQPEPLHTRRARALLELGLLELAQAELPDSGRLVPAELAVLKAIRNRCEDLDLRARSLRLSARIVTHDYGPEELPHAYPRYFFDRVQLAAREAQVDPCLVISVIRQESFFDSGAVSPVGALGLMQIMPQTGQQLARRLGVVPFSRERLLEAQLSIRMGSHYLAEQVRAFQAGPAPELGLELGLAAYNAGPEAARRWLQRYPHSDPDLFVERIPYKETRLYVKKVMRNFAIYKTLTQV